MAQSRFFDDSLRIEKRLEISRSSGEYYLNAPGPGTQLPLNDDVHLRMQKWGANVMTNTVNLESDLKGINRSINRHHVDAIPYGSSKPSAAPVEFPTEAPYVEESRASHPAWMYKDLDHSRWAYPQLNPQNLATIEKPFLYDVQTRIIQRDQTVSYAVPAFEPRNIFPLASQGPDEALPSAFPKLGTQS